MPFWPPPRSLAFAAPAAAAPTDDFQAILREHYAWLLRENPVEATALGVRDYDDRIRDLSPEARDRRTREAQAFLDRMNRIDPAQLSPADRVNYGILRRLLGEAGRGERLRPARHAVHHLCRLAPGFRRHGPQPAPSAPAPIMKATSPASLNIRG